MSRFEAGMFKKFEEFLPELRKDELNFVAGGEDLIELVRQEAELRGIDSNRLVACSLNLLMLVGEESQQSRFSLRDAMGYEEDVDLMCDKYKPTPHTSEDEDELIVATGPDLALEFMVIGWKKKISTEEVLGRSILMGLDISVSERSGSLLMLTIDGNRHPMEMIF